LPIVFQEIQKVSKLMVYSMIQSMNLSITSNNHNVCL